MAPRPYPKVGIRLPSALAQFMVGLGLAQSDFVCGICGLYLLFPLCPPLVLPFWPLSVKTAHLLCWIQAFLRCKFEVEFHDRGCQGCRPMGKQVCFPLLGLEKWLSSWEHFLLFPASKSYTPLTSHTLLKIKINGRKFSIFVCRGFTPSTQRILSICVLCLQSLSPGSVWFRLSLASIPASHREPLLWSGTCCRVEGTGRKTWVCIFLC